MPDNIHIRHGANLSHWMRAEGNLLDRQAEMGVVELTPEELVRRAKLKSEAYLELLDNGHATLHNLPGQLWGLAASDGLGYR